MRQIALISLGSNQLSFWGSSLETVQRAVAELSALGEGDVRVSRFYETPAFPKGIGPDFVNAAMQIETDLAPSELLARLHAIEAEAGRERTVRWGQRTLDLDLLALGQVVSPDIDTYLSWHDLPPEAQKEQAPEELILPHPRLQDRAFVLVPLSKIAPNWRHPVLDRTVQELCAALHSEQRAEVVPLDHAKTA